MPPKRVASEAAKATQGRACFEGRCGSAFLASCGRASPVCRPEFSIIRLKNNSIYLKPDESFVYIGGRVLIS